MFKYISGLMIGMILLTCTPANADGDIIIGPGKGILWSGLPYNLSRVREDKVTTTRVYPSLILGFNSGNYQAECSDSMVAGMEAISAGLWGFKVVPGVYLIPRATVSGSMSVGFYGVKKDINGTLGYPETKVDGSLGVLGFCATTPEYYVRAGYEMRFNISGDWVIYADGTQTPTAKAVTLPVFQVYGAAVGGPVNRPLTLKVAGVDCSVSTPNNINFGNILYSGIENQELATVISPFTVSCKQGAVPAAVNINASFRANSGIYNTDSTQLALTQGGGYITGEMGNGMTGSGSCAAHPTALKFDQTLLKLTALPLADPSVDFNSTITWRLCSGGATLPVGSISASTELSIVFS